MSESVMNLEKPASVGPAPAMQQDSDVWVKSYCYVRTAMVGLLVGLGVAVLYQTWRQGWHPLGSVSAYYYTPAQGIFVGGLIGLGACMIALKGTNDVEDVFLNLGGMFAAVVAIVPTSRGEDYRTAVLACQKTGDSLLGTVTQKDSGLDCPTVNALADAARANVENNISTLLIVGVIGLIATALFALRYRGFGRGASTVRNPSSPHKFWWGFGAAVLVWAAGSFVFVAYTDWFAGNAHYIAAGGLFLCIVVVAMANAFRRRDTQPPPDGSALTRTLNIVGAATVDLIRPSRVDPYVWLARLMLVAAVAGIVLELSHVISLFVLEIVVAGLFLGFWMWQTVERLPRAGQPAGQ
jgi:hypothetical protein